MSTRTQRQIQPENSSNGSNAILYWLMGAMLAVILALGSWAINTSTSQAGEVRRSVEMQGQRISRVEASLDSLKEEAIRRLDRIDARLDTLNSTGQPVVKGSDQ